MTGGNVYLSGDKAAAQSLIPEAQQCVAIVRAMRDALELDELERVFSLNGGTCRVVLGKYSEQLYIQPDPPEPPEEEEPEEEIDLGDAPILYHKLAMPWRPEGIIFTPVTESQPNGLGLPMRDVDTGDINREIDPGNPNQLGPIEYTEGGQLPQVLMNRFANNKYMDNLLYVNGLPPEISLAQPSRSYRLSERYELDDNDEVKSFPSANQQIYFSTTPTYGHPHSWGDADSDDPAQHYDLNDGSIMPELAGGLFAVRGILEPDADNGGLVEIQTKTTQELPASALSEPEQAEWYSHRPEEMLYPSGVKEYIFREHNRLRREVGVGDFRRPLRGDGDMGDYGNYMMGEHNDPRYGGHSHYDWMPGFRTAGGRHASFTGQGIRNLYADNPVENLVTFSLSYQDSADIDTEKGLAEYMVDLWRNSPGHYAGIIAEQWDYDWNRNHLDVQSDNIAAYARYGACLNIGAAARYAGVWTFYDVNAPDAPNGQSWNENPLIPQIPDGTPGLVTYNVMFDQRSTWLPTPHITTEIGAFGVGGVGFFNGGNPIVSDPNIGFYSRFFAIDNHLQWMPPNQGGVFYTTYAQNEPPYPYAWWETDRFLALAGAHPYEKKLIRVDAEGNETEFTQTWMRVVYWESDFLSKGNEDQLSGLIPPNTRTSYPLATYLTVKIATFPLSVTDTHVLPWRDPIGDGVEWAIEDEFTWSEPDYLACYAPTVDFTSDGNKLCFQVYKLGEPVNRRQYISDTAIFFQDYSYITINGRSPYDPIDTKNSVGWWYPAVPVTVEWTPDFGFEEEEPQEPIIAVVDARCDDIDMGENDGRFSLQVNHYESSAQGSYRILPHYNDSDELQHVEAVVDFYSIQRRFAQFAYWHIKEGFYPPPEGEEPHDDYLWCQMKLVFPSGKEWVYHQANRTFPEPPPAQATGDIPLTPFYDHFTPHPDSPYQEGGTFNCHLLHIDVHREDVIYLQSTGNMYRWTVYNDTTEDDDIFDIVVQDQKIVRDWSDEDEPVVMWEKLHTPPVDYQWVHGDYTGGVPEFWARSPGRWDQDTGTDSFVRPWFLSGRTRTLNESHVSEYIDTTLFTFTTGIGRLNDAKLFHDDVYRKVNCHEVARNFTYIAPYNTVLYGAYGDLLWWLSRNTPDNYALSGAPSRWGGYRLEQASTNSHYRTGVATPASVMPSYVGNSNAVVRVMRYKDRFLIRIWIDDMPLVGGKPENVSYTSNDTIPDYTSPPYRPDPSGEPLLLIDSNFDLDEAAGMEGVKDIYPCGVLY